MSIELKICGINSKNIIQTIIQNGGCQYLGFIFYPLSPRNLSTEYSKKPSGSISDNKPGICYSLNKSKIIQQFNITILN